MASDAMGGEPRNPSWNDPTEGTPASTRATSLPRARRALACTLPCALPRALPYWGIFLVALGVRVAYLLEWQATPLFSVLVGDARGYDLWAREIAAGDWFGREVFYQAPLYPYFLGALYRLFGHELWAPRIAQIVLGSLACVLLAWGGRRFFSRRAGLVAGLLLALYAPAIYFDGLIQKASLDLFFTTLLLFLLGEFLARGRWTWLAGAGCVLGCFALTRENALLLLPLVALWVVVQFRSERPVRRLGWVTALAVGAALVLGPVGLRNQLLGDRFLITTSQLGPNFYIGNNPDATGRYVPLRKGRGSVRYERRDAIALAERDVGRELSPAEVSDYWLARSLAFIRTEPGRWARLTATKWLLVWNAGEVADTDSIEAYREASTLLSVLGLGLHFGVLVPLAALGAWTTRRDWRRLWLLHAVALGMAASVAFFFVLGRYRVPMVPVLVLFAAAGGIELWRRCRGGDWAGLARGLAVLVPFAVFSNWPLPASEDPRAVTHYSLGVALTERASYAEAVAQLERALELAPHSPLVHFGLGEALRRRGELDGAIRHHREAVHLDPESADAHNALGVALAGSGRLDEAMEHYREALELDSMLADAHNNLANALLQSGRVAQALPHYEQALAIRPDEANLYFNYANALLAAGEPPAALLRYEQALEIDPGHLRAQYRRALTLEQLGRIREAMEGYEGVLRLKPSPRHPAHVNASSRLARLLATCSEPELRDGARAVRLAEQAVRGSGGAHLGALEALAAAYAEVGRFEQAVREMRRAVDLAVARGEEERAHELREGLAGYERRRADRVVCGAPAPGS